MQLQVDQARSGAHRPGERRRLKRSVRSTLITLVALVAGGLAWLTPTPSVSAAEVRTASLSGEGDVTVYWMGTNYPTSRIETLLNIADNSTCTADANGNDCNGAITAGDVIVMGDHYLAWLDKTRNATQSGGGGGLLRGLWRLTGSGDTKNFFYVYGTNNWAPNLLLPCQNANCKPEGPDGLELLLSPVKNDFQEPDQPFRGSDALNVTVANATFVTGEPRWEIRVTGTLARANGDTDVDLGQGAKRRSRADYNVFYTFWNNAFAPGDNRSLAAVDIRTTIDACGDCPGTPSPMATAVQSLSLSTGSARQPPPPENAVDQLKLDNFKPLSHPMWWEGHPDFASSNGCPPGNPDHYHVGQQYSTGGVLTSRTPGPFSMRITSQPGDDLGGNHLQISDSTISGTNGFDVSNKAYHQHGFDIHDVSIYDQKVAGVGGCTEDVRLQRGQSIVFALRLGLWYEDPSPPTNTTIVAPPTTLSSTTTTTIPPTTTTAPPTSTTTRPPTTTTTVPPPPPPRCSNGVDDDGDGRIDYPADHGCFAGNDDIEDGPADRLLPDQELWLDEYLVDPSYRYCVVMQGDGNVVLYNYDALNRRCFIPPAHWTTQTNGFGCCYRFRMQGDGNLVVQRGIEAPIWFRPGATRVPGSYLRLQCDRNLVIYTPSGGVTWNSGTSTGQC